MLPSGDAQLLRIVDAAFADARQRSGGWLLCGPGCNQCCTGVFRISALDAERLRAGLRHLEAADPACASRLRERVQTSADRLAASFPGDPGRGVLDDTTEAQEAFAGFADHEICPVLNPLTGTCDLYAFRPMTCRTFGPPVRTEDGFGVCELCFAGASPDEVKHAAMELPAPVLEEKLNAETHLSGETIVTFALARSG